MLLLTKSQIDEKDSSRYLTYLGDGLTRLRRNCISQLEGKDVEHTSISLKILHSLKFIGSDSISKSCLIINKTVDVPHRFKPEISNIRLDISREYKQIHIERFVKSSLILTEKTLAEIDFDKIVFVNTFEHKFEMILKRNNIKRISIKPNIVFSDKKVVEVNCIIF